MTGSTGLNMPRELLDRIPPHMRDAFMTSIIEHANRGPVMKDGQVVAPGVTDGSKGIIPGIENIGQNPELMQKVLALPPEDRAKALEEFLDKHQEDRREFDDKPRFTL